VIENCVYNWDGYAGNGNNYALYWNPVDNVFEVKHGFSIIINEKYMVWDFDFTYENPRIPVYQWSSDSAVLYNRIMEIEPFRKLYKSYYLDFLEFIWKTETHKNRIRTLETFLLPAAKVNS
jgi:hypothetical protein